MRCPKELRNGPCGGTRPNGHCEAFPERPCIWYLIYRRASLFGRLKMLYRVEKIHNWNLEKTSAWLNVFVKRIEPPKWRVPKGEGWEEAEKEGPCGDSNEGSCAGEVK